MPCVIELGEVTWVTAVVAGLNGAGPGGAVRPGEALARLLPGDRRGSTRIAPVPRSRPGILLDRDGTIIVDHEYVGSINRVEFIEGAPEAIAASTGPVFPSRS